MAEEDAIEQRSETESFINRWIVDYYISLALELFQKDQYEDFCEVRDVISSIIVRPVAKNDVMPRKLLVMQLLSRVNEGEKLDMTFEKDNDGISPLESALMQLESLSQEIDVQKEDLKNVCTLVKEMIVKLFIKNKDFIKAKEAIRHLPKSMVAKKQIFMDLISKKSNKHKVIEELDFKQLKVEISAFCLKFCSFSVPFLHKAAKQLIDQLNKQNAESTTTDESDECGPSNRPCAQVNIQLRICEHSIIPKERLKSAYQALAAGLVLPFSHLEEEVENETAIAIPAPEIEDTNKNSENEESFQTNSCRPLEVTPPTQTDAPPQSKTGSPHNTDRKETRASVLKWQHHNIAKMVMQPDSQPSLLYATPQEQEAAVRVQEPAESQTVACQIPQTDTEVVPLMRPQLPTHTKSRSSSNDDEASPQCEEQSSSSAGSKRVSLKTCNEAFPNGSSADDETSPQCEEQSSSLAGSMEVSRRTCNQALPNGKSTESEELSAITVHVVQDSPVNNETPVEKQSSDSLSKFMGNTNEVIITDSSLDCSPSLIHQCRSPQKCSTPNKDTSRTKWKNMLSNAKETKVNWTEEEELFNESFNKSSSSRKRKWTEEESQKLRNGVKKFGEGNWSKIKAYYSFRERTNVHLKDRWRTMKKLNLI
ncbi:telomeric repeat binding factor a [Phyllopteryx taeniolatus]|uniref:telomeric repeat binding factor a n=1 Tax=Phyllopteryx taeniolatus TaxID=161469 RepID=UPI002AD32E82|nr:telomeric repeat binding factor a [Phyllopteryx taeniolatus]